MIDVNIKRFFNVLHLDLNNFSFEELVQGYGSMLLLLLNEDEDFYYLNIDFLNDCVITFSKILRMFFTNDEVDLSSLTSLIIETSSIIRDKSSDEYTENDLVLMLSLFVSNSFIVEKSQKELDNIMPVIYTMIENYCLIDSISKDMIMLKKFYVNS